ncbi:polysaccharide pyruvyl transferase family protein [Gloeobacter morelensis]|uniref:Polysaccharide pyruvyl transferase family protein n=1 Tax=Gloeobacter morelensis MG652769 TaxID=2781736 RepID=A0ABY3PJB0_9CYAN|nr:polysaccharide pyruvyl transferase family protein [Gloeobacter morelensis]UFP93741.1 polysaccharide pyruvyl transferase family protein [Gloeobacter morelensis MG652769]
MKIGIVTFHHTTNYGATLQTYALWKTLSRQGHAVEIIDYQPTAAVKYYLKEFLPGRPVLSNLKKAWKMSAFLRSQMRLGAKTCYTREQLKRHHGQYDAVICGSDQIWCIDAFRGYDPSFFLDFVDGRTTRKISYAASAGYTRTLGERQGAIRDLLGDFWALSVRDANTASLVERECQLNSTHVLDPTFLVDYGEFLAQPAVGNYLLIYKMGPMSRPEEQSILALAKARGLKIVSVGFEHRIADQNLIGAGPVEWINGFAGARYVFTDTFHGTIFSIIFRKPFYTFISKNKAAKIGDLLHNLGLAKRMIDAQSEPVVDFGDLDYTAVNPQLEERIAGSKAFLRQALTSARPLLRPRTHPAEALYRPALG